MNREFKWNDISDDHAVLYGPEAYMVAAVITLGYEKEDMSDLCWRVMSGSYKSLNIEEYDTSISLQQLKRRALILLGNELEQERRALDADISNILGMLMEQEAKAG